MDESRQRMDTFGQVWRKLASEGKADAEGGAQYCRALADWQRGALQWPIAAWLAGWLAADNHTPPHDFEGRGK